MIVQKYGGGILATREDYARVASIVESTRPSCVVVSAVQGVTDELISLLEAARAGEGFGARLDALKRRHEEIAGGVFPEGNAVFSLLEKTLSGVELTGEYSDRLYAQFVSRGEYLSALLLRQLLPGYSFAPAEACMGAEGDYRNARVDAGRTRRPPSFSIVPGFYGVNERGEICLYGRGGSDYSAGIIAMALGASKLEFWKNVEGFMTTDPRVCPAASFVPVISFAEARELCYFGAKVLHPAALLPIAGTETTVVIKNVFRPDSEGTRIIRSKPATLGLAAVAGKKGVSVVSASGERMVGASGCAAEILSAVARSGVSVDVISTAQSNLSFTIDSSQAPAAVASIESLGGYSVSSKHFMATIGIVGDGVAHDCSVLANAFIALSRAGIGVEMVSQGASEIDLSIVVRQDDYERAIRCLHAEFFEKGGF